MDCSWLHEEADEADSLDSDKSDSEEVERELESRLYAIIHHNDLSQPLPVELAKHYSLQHSDDGDVMVTLNQSLEQLKSEENKEIDKVLQAPKPTDEEVLGDKEIVIISDDEKEIQVIKEVAATNHQHIKKRLRYSDVNIDEVNKSQNKSNDGNLNNVNRAMMAKTSDVNHSNNAKSPFSNINIPRFFDYSNWDGNYNGSFKLIGSKMMKQLKFKWKLKNALIQLNPGVKRKKLFNFADMLIRQNAAIAKQAEETELKNAMRNNLLNGLDIMSNLPTILIEDTFPVNKGLTGNGNICETNLQKPTKVNKNEDMYLNLSSSKYNSPTMNSASNKKSNPKSQIKQILDGSVSLNASPFRPKTQFTKINMEDGQNTSQSYLPTKWNNKMIHFYTLPSKKKMKSNINSIFNKFQRTTTAEDWQLDPRDITGVYQRPRTTVLQNLKKTHRRCNNCRRKGHTSQNCPDPKKLTVCFLCGDPYHTGYLCQKTVCMKCGEYSPEGECVECYYSTFQFTTSCERCGSVLHRTPHCPDSWRSFHATIEGELKIPDKLIENRRKFCCNCAHRGHFSHNCPAPYHTGQQTTPFITNYSSSTLDKGSTDIFLPNKYEEIITSPDADIFLQGLSNMSSAQIQMNVDSKGVLLTINGTFEQCINVRSEIQEFVNIKKRKREEPQIRKKRRRLK